MSIRNQLNGLIFGKLKVIDIAFSKNGNSYWNTICECSGTKIVRGAYLLDGQTKSCGCLRRPKNETSRKTECRKTESHGMTGTKIYMIWTAMKMRCTNPNHRAFHNYGGRGINVCKEWLNSFSQFYADMGDKPEGLELDRRDNDGDYCKENCRWVTRSVNNLNKSRK